MSNTSNAIIEIEFDTGDDCNYLFHPLDGRSLRGRFDHRRYAEHSRDALLTAAAWGDKPIPGQHVGMDLSKGEGFVREPLHLDQHRLLKGRIEARGLKLEPELQTFPLEGDRRTAWLWHMKRAVDLGFATIKQGMFPQHVPAPPKPIGNLDPVERLAVSIERLLERLGPTLATS